MLGVSPGLFAVNRAATWEQVRTLVWPLVVVLVGQFTVSLLNGGSLQIVKGGPIVAVFFSLGWVAVFAVLALSALIAVARQYTRARGQDPARAVTLPAWTRPSLAVLGSSWLGIGAGLLFLPGFWSRFVPWSVNRLDAQSLGLWALALGIGVLGALAEDDLTRARPALLASTTTALTVGVVLAAHPGSVHWHTGGAVSLLALLAGLLISGLTGRRLLSGGVARPAGGRIRTTS
jgi:hypothetical protein